MKDSISIQDIFSTLRKRLAFILLIPFAIVAIVAVLSYFVLTPMYQASSQFIVIQQQNDNLQVNLNDIETNIEIINTYNEIIKSPFILEKVIAELNLTTSPEQLAKKIEVSSGENSQVVTVSAVETNPEAAAILANTVVGQFQTSITSILKIDNVHVLSEAKASLAMEPIKPRPIINMIIAGVFGFATSIGIVLLMEFLSTKVKFERDIEQLGIPVLGVVSNANKKQTKRGKSIHTSLREGNTYEA